MQLDPSLIDEKVAEARCSVDYSRDTLRYQVENINQTTRNRDGSIAVTTFDAYTFMQRLDEYIDARAGLQLLELIRSPLFYSALMRSAAEVEDKTP